MSTAALSGATAPAGTAARSTRSIRLGLPAWVGSRRPLTLIVLLAMLTMAPIIVLAAATVTTANAAMTDAASQRLGGVSTLAAKYVDQQMTSLATVETGYARRPSLVAALVDGDHAAWDAAAILANLQDFRDVEPGARFAAVFDASGTYWGQEVPATHPELLGRNFATRDWYGGVTRTGQTYVSAAYASAITGSPLVVGIASPVRADGAFAPAGKVVGIMLARYEITQTQAMFSQFAQQQRVGIEVTDQHGVVVAQSDAAPSSLTTDTRRGVAQALAGKATLARDVYRGQDYFEAYSPVRGIGWTVVARAPAAEALASADRLLGYVVTTALVLILFLIGGTLFTYQILRERHIAQRSLAVANVDLKDRAAELTDTNNELMTFTYGISHDLRAPLRAIAGFAGLLEQKESTHLSDDGRQYLARIDANATKMRRLIDELLRLSRLGRATMQLDDVDMDALAANVAGDFREQAAAAGVELVVRPLLPARGDGPLLQQVLSNLVSNAVKFSRFRPGARVEVGSHVENGEIVYDVRDNGVGFDMRYADKLFGVFQRLHTEAEFEGTGVGLALVQRIVRRHGGRIWAEAEKDRGATFHFTIGTRAGDPASPRPRDRDGGAVWQVPTGAAHPQITGIDMATSPGARPR